MIASLRRCLSYAALQPTLLDTIAMNRFFTTVPSQPPPRVKPPSATPRAVLHEAPTSATAFLSQLRTDEGVVLGDADTVLHKLQRMYQGGLSSLHIITDFGTPLQQTCSPPLHTSIRLHIDQVLGRRQAKRNVTCSGGQQPSTSRAGVPWLHVDPHTHCFKPTQAKQDIDGLYTRYYPIEVNATMTEAEKRPHMETWWRSVRCTAISR